MTIYRDRNAEQVHFVMSRSGSQGNQIAFAVNPSETQWRIGLRSSIEKIAGGAVYHTWQTEGSIGQPLGTMLDLPQLSISFQSGNILPNGYGDNPEGNVPKGLGNFYDFIALLDQTGLQPNGQINYVNIVYTSNIFPLVTLQGYFSEEGVSWTDTSSDPNQIVSWGANFIVFNSHPEINNPYLLKLSYNNPSQGLSLASVDRNLLETNIANNNESIG